MTYQDRPASPQPVRLTVDDYLLLDESGAFADYGKTELIDGTILGMNAVHSRHARMHAAFVAALSEASRTSGLGLIVLIEPSVLLDRCSLPQPDIAIFRDAPDDGLLPLAGLLLAAEIADSSLDFDLGRKAALYAEAGIPECWVADTAGGTLHQMWGPAPGGYGEHHRQAFGTRLRAATLPIETDLPTL